MKINYIKMNLEEEILSKENFTVKENDFYKEIAKKLCKEDVSKHGLMVKIKSPKGEVLYKVVLRSGTHFITQLDNNLPKITSSEDSKVRYLTCVIPQKNAYKFYKIMPNNQDETIKVSYGRMGVKKGELFGERTYVYPKSMYWIKYFEKIGKGYVDRSDIYVSDCSTKKIDVTKKVDDSANNLTDTVSVKLYNQLREMSKKAVKEAKVFVPITPNIILTAKQLVDNLRQCTDVTDFNKIILNLMATLQRPVATGDGTGVKKQLASSVNDFADIIIRESNLIQAMEGAVENNGTLKSFDDLSVEVYIATNKQVEEVKRHLSPEMVAKIKTVYRVIPRKQKTLFNQYLKENKIRKVKEFWHGSRNENWLSIIENSLSLNPDAVITGKMFGYGIYFAPKAEKSWNYTSYKNSYFAKGNSNIAFMGLYATAYGEPHYVQKWSSCDYKKLVEDNGKNCLHAQAGISLYNDEIVFYDENAILLNYIVEFQ